MRAMNVTAVVMIAATALVSGCRIESNKKDGNDNVKIATPFGGMTVKTNDEAVVEGLGLPVYPGAELVKKDKNNGAADVNMSFGSFQLRVKAASYRTSDSPDQVIDVLSQGAGTVRRRDSVPERQACGYADPDGGGAELRQRERESCLRQ